MHHPVLSPVHQCVSPAENGSKIDIHSHSLLSRLAYTLCIGSLNVGTSHMAYLCHPLLDGRHGFLKRSPCGQTGIGLRIRTTSGKLREPSHKQGMQGMIEYIKTTYVQPITTQGEPVTAVGYGFTDLRIYTPPSPSSRAPRSRASANQVCAGYSHRATARWRRYGGPAGCRGDCRELGAWIVVVPSVVDAECPSARIPDRDFRRRPDRSRLAAPA